jgi:hypothetical protein
MFIFSFAAQPGKRGGHFELLPVPRAKLGSDKTSAETVSSGIDHFIKTLHNARS